MKKIIILLSYIGLLTTSISASECKLIVTPSDFQLDYKLKAANESYAFSTVGNLSFTTYVREYAKAFFCTGLARNDTDKVTACMEEVDNFIEKDSAKAKGLKFSETMDRLDIDGYKTSKHTPISKEHLCSLQKKYKTDTSSSRSLLLPLLENNQERMRRTYLEASETLGQSEDVDTIADAMRMKREN
jgi:hypothetical protein